MTVIIVAIWLFFAGGANRQVQLLVSCVPPSKV